jgi:hypothetical protein
MRWCGLKTPHDEAARCAAWLVVSGWWLVISFGCAQFVQPRPEIVYLNPSPDSETLSDAPTALSLMASAP